MSIELKIKSKHLAEEAKIIRFEERKLKGQIKWHSKRQSLDPKMVEQYQSIHNHRTFDVRNENRATFLARHYLAGRPYKTIEWERNPSSEWNFRNRVLPRVFDMVNKYGPEKDRIERKTIRNQHGMIVRFDFDPEEKKIAMKKIEDWLNGDTTVNKSFVDKVIEAIGF